MVSKTIVGELCRGASAPVAPRVDAGTLAEVAGPLLGMGAAFKTESPCLMLDWTPAPSGRIGGATFEANSDISMRLSTHYITAMKNINKF
jgi:hypothetical protein